MSQSAESTKADVVSSAIGEISHIATLPEVTLKIINLVEDPNSTAQDLNRVITNDPALGARILKVVNSAFYGLPGQIASINRAIVLLGLNAVKNIAIAASLAKLFRGGQIAPHFDAHDLWNHSIAVATATKMIGKEAGLGLADEAFLAGLIHDIGIMVEIQAMRAKFVEVILKKKENPELTLRSIETEILGADHQEFGAGLCKAWKFPNSFIYVTGYHHNPMDLEPDERKLACAVNLADIIVAKLGIGYTDTVDKIKLNKEVLDDLNLTTKQVEKVMEALPNAMSEAENLLDAA
ncbi:MAG: HDOD domain-containing protein [Phycisphaeraceae bacterium JB051]